eukprot:747762-Hanusia_phi.AAC.2
MASPPLTRSFSGPQSMRNEIQVVTCIGDVAFSALAVTHRHSLYRFGSPLSSPGDLAPSARRCSFLRQVLSDGDPLTGLAPARSSLRELTHSTGGYRLDIHPLTKIGVLCTLLAGIVACTFQVACGRLRAADAAQACELLNRMTVIGQCTSTEIQVERGRRNQRSCSRLSRRSSRPC